MVEEKEEEGQEQAFLETKEKGGGEPERLVKRKQREEREESDPPSISEEGSIAELAGEEIEEMLVKYRKWLKENDVAGLTVAQMAAHMVIQLKKSGTNFGKFLLRMVSEPPGVEGQARQRSVLPLPLLPDASKELKKIWESEEYRRLMGSWSGKT